MKTQLPSLYFDYTLQVWVEDGMIQNCAHPGKCDCNKRMLAGLHITQIKPECRDTINPGARR